MRKNVIILTSGLSGSSVLTGLVARTGCWTGDATFKKQDYDTFENRELIELNLRLFREAGYTGNYLLEFSPETVQNVAALYGKIDDRGFRAFLDKCNRHQPWIWKDPRLWLTIRFWNNLLDIGSCRFLVLTRGAMQSWISSILRRQITTYRYSRAYERKILESAIEFLNQNRLPYLHVTYEGLIMRPAETIQRLNRHLDSGLTVEDLKAVYHKPLYKNPRSSLMKHAKAMLIYAKNYSERLDLAG
jgi:hypothetical protein